MFIYFQVTEVTGLKARVDTLEEANKLLSEQSRTIGQLKNQSIATQQQLTDQNNTIANISSLFAIKDQLLSDQVKSNDLLKNQSLAQNQTIEDMKAVLISQQVKTGNQETKLQNLQSTIDILLQKQNNQQNIIDQLKNQTQDSTSNVTHIIGNLEAKLQNQESTINQLLVNQSNQKHAINSLINQTQHDAQKISYLLQKLSNLTKKTNTHVEFFALLSKSALYSTGNTIIYDVAATNVGGGYSPQTGVFTAPVAGMYKIQAYAVTFGNNYVCLKLKCKGVYLFILCDHSPVGDYDAAGNAGYVHLDQGQTCHMESRDNNVYFHRINSGGAEANSFSGHLIYSD